MTPYVPIVMVMTETPATTRQGAASEFSGYATVTAADTITSQAVLEEVAAGYSVS